ncbi:MAG: transglutaminase domain-containing protein [Oscillospiraceae bacterium]|nr:transglutaminase domain-containing protein [Oscillospiraceae bacterium]MDD4413811.1 transglutaminase domain-containing protein [Oscillospiraceae bacterium]
MSVIFSFSTVALTDDNNVAIYKQDTDFTVVYSSYNSNFSFGSFNYYSQLDKNQQAIYNGLKEITPLSDKMIISLATPITFTAKSGNPTDAEWESSKMEISRIVQGALDALIMDYPEIFWLDIKNCIPGIPDNDVFGIKKGDNFLFTINRIEFTFALINSYVPIKEQIVNTLMSKVNSIPVTGSSRYEKVLSIHNELATRISYDYSYSELSYNAYGALVDGVAVCEGYSEAFKLICDKYDIPCILVVGKGGTSSGLQEPHMWNAVKMEDNKWYGVDVTWDDQTEYNNYIYRDYFLVGSSTEAKKFQNSLPFSESHLESGYFTSSEISKEFTYPPLALNAYVPGGSIIVTTQPVPSGTVEPPSPSETKSKPTKAPTKTKANVKTTSAAKATSEITKINTTTSTVQTGELSDKTTTTAFHKNGNNSISNTQTKNGKNNAAASTYFNIILIAPYIAAGITVITIITLLIIFIFNKKK